MEEKNLVELPEKVAKYLEYMRKGNYTLLGALGVRANDKYAKNLIGDYFGSKYNQEKFARAWLDGYKTEEKIFIVKFKNIDDVYGYLNYEREAKIFKLSSVDESTYFKTHFTKTFLEENGFGWIFDSEGVHIIEVEND